MELLKEYWIPWLVSNTIAVLLLWTAYKKPKLTRFLLMLVFGWACWLNYTTSHETPEDYLQYAALTPFGPYRDFIIGWFSEHITPIVSTIAIGQGLIAIGMALKGFLVRLACIGAIVFLIAISPLGIGSGFPAPVIIAFAIYMVLKKDDLNYLWHKAS